MSLPAVLQELFSNVGIVLPAAVAALMAAVAILLLLVAPVAGLCTYIERKLAADFQERVGPNRVGPIGILQFLADGIKLILKEDTAPLNADKLIFNIAPSLVVGGALGAFAAVPFTRNVLGADLDIGIFWVMALGSLVSLGILLGAWSSDNKWSLLGGMRSAAQIISYEIPLGLCLLTIVTLSGTFSLVEVVQAQSWPNSIGGSGGTFWYVFHNPFVFVNFFVYFIASLAECNRTPFDLPEAESELVSGFNTEFSGMRFGLYAAIGEFGDILLFACVATALFFGGWHLPFVNLETLELGLIFAGYSFDPVVKTLLMFAVFVAKSAGFVFVVMWLRWTLPRLRMDQLMGMCWKYMIPIGFFNLFGCAVWMWFFKGQSILQLLGLHG